MSYPLSDGSAGVAPESAPAETETRRFGLQRLAEQVRRLESGMASRSSDDLTSSCRKRQPLGLAGIDHLLGGGLPTGCVHEIIGPPGDAAAPGFAAAILARFALRGTVVWITSRRAALYVPGLCGLGLDPRSLLVIEAPARSARLWALAEALRAPGIAAAVAELDAVDFTLSRRLQLAATTTGASALILDEGPLRRQPSAARTRWRIAATSSRSRGETSPLPSSAARAGLGPPRWRLDLLRGPAATTGNWVIECTIGGLSHVDLHDVRPSSAPGRGDIGSVVASSGVHASLPVAVAPLPADRPHPTRTPPRRHVA